MAKQDGSNSHVSAMAAGTFTEDGRLGDTTYDAVTSAEFDCMLDTDDGAIVVMTSGTTHDISGDLGATTRVNSSATKIYTVLTCKPILHHLTKRVAFSHSVG